MTMNGLPNFIIIGAQKTGSTYIHGLLRSHPDIYMPAEEVRFFEDPEYGTGNLEPLKAMFRDRSTPLRGIKRPDYLARPEVPARIAHHVPSARLIAILRQPVQRLVSAYYYYVKLGFLPVLPINQGLRRILDGESLGSTRTGELLEYGRYATQLERYLAIFPSEQLLILLQEEVMTAPLQTINRVVDFLGATRFNQLPQVERDNSGLYSVPRLHWLTQRNRFLYDYDPAGKLIEKTSTLSYAGAAAITAVDRYLLAPVFGNQKPVLDPGLNAELECFYRPEINRLETLLQRSLNGWAGTS